MIDEAGVEINEASQQVSILLVDDEAPLRRALHRYLKRAGYDVHTAADLATGRAALEKRSFDVAIVDFRLPDGNGDSLIRWAVDNHRARWVYCMTGHASCRTAVDVMRAGCVDVLEKPVDAADIEVLIATKAAARNTTEEELDEWRHRYARHIAGDDARLRDALVTIKSVADTTCTVLITGESGTGKELLARAVHDGSPRRSGPFVALNCAAIPDSMVEAELFGHARGAFTGAVTERTGRCASAHGGTLFLDEIGDMPLAAQAKLLRMLQDRTITPVGADDSIEIDVRIVAATNKDLEAMVEEGTFRADLYYRLSVIPVHLPPLRERSGDAVLLAQSFVLAASERNGRSVTGLDATAHKALVSYDWPGNVRELHHVIERAVLLKGRGVLTADDLRLKKAKHPPVAAAAAAVVTAAASATSKVPATTPEGLDLKRAIDQVERQLIDEALERTGGNRTEAAALLGLNRTTLVEKIRKHTA